MGEDKEEKPILDMNQDIGVFTIKEFKTYHKKGLLEGRLHYLSERVRYYQAEMHTSLGASFLGAMISGVGFLTEENYIGMAGIGVAIFGGLFAYGNSRRQKPYKQRLQKTKERLEILENNPIYNTLDDKMQEHIYSR